MVYPNPAANNINIVVEGGINKQKVSLINTVGQPLNVTVQKNSFTSGSVDISSLPAGVYWVKRQRKRSKRASYETFCKNVNLLFGAA